ncbi:hydrolase [Gordonia phage Schwartz33]|nr:hydrolase [Gordonia phage Schwartz33]
MTFLQAVNPGIEYKRYFEDFNAMSNGPLPYDWYVRILQGVGPEVYTNFVRAAQTNTLNSQSRSMLVYSEPVATDDQILRVNTATAVDGLLSGLIIRSDIMMYNCLLAILSTNNNERGLYRMVDGLTTRVATFPSAFSTGETWGLKAEGSLVSLIRNPLWNNTGGSLVASWDDTSGLSLKGEDYRYGGMFVNSDRNAFSIRNHSAGLDNYDFRDLGWVA